MSISHIALPFSLQIENPFSLLGSVLVPRRESFSPKVGIYFPPLVTNIPLLQNNMPLLQNNMPLLQDLTPEVMLGPCPVQVFQ